MKRLALVVLVGACAAPAEAPTLQLECATGVPCGSGTLGVGGLVFTTTVGDASFVSSDDRVLQVRSADPVPSVVGAAPGRAELMLLESGRIIDRVSIDVAPVAELRLMSADLQGPYLADGLDGSYAARANEPVSIALEPLVGVARSMGTHYYDVALDGSPYTCWGSSPRFCDGPVRDDTLSLDPLAAGTHALDFTSLDGGREFHFSIVAR